MALFYYPKIEVIVINATGFRVPIASAVVEFFNITQDVSITSIVADSEGNIDAGSFNDALEPVALMDVVELRHGTYDGTARLTLQATAEAASEAVENHVLTYVLVNNYTFIDPDAAIVIVSDLDDSSVDPYILGTVQAMGTTAVPFNAVTGKNYRFYVARQHADWDFSAADLEQLDYKDLFTSTGGSDSPPTFTSVTYDSANSEVDLVFAKNGTAVGDIQVEYKLTTASTWTTHGTTFAHGATSGSIVIEEEPTAKTYDIRLKQVGVAGYSTVRQVTVDASGAGTPPSSLTADATYLGSCGWQVDLDWTAGSGSGNYTVEQKQGSGGSWGVLTSTEASTSYTDTSIVGSQVGSTTYYYRVKQNDVSGYSNEVLVFIERCDDPI